jgi:hypothetical protein
LQKPRLDPVEDWDAKKMAYLAIQQKHERQNRKKKKVSLSPIHGAAVLDKESFKESTSTMWWNQTPSIAGEACNKYQHKLSEVDTFTGTYKNKIRGVKDCSSGNYCADPIRATRVLQSLNYHELTNHGLAGNFRNEVEWRMQLRPQFN